jgi:hypothetical protein
MVPRGEVGLIFAQFGLSAGVLSSGLYGSVALMVMVTTFVAPPALRALLNKSVPTGGTQEILLSNLVTETLADSVDPNHEREDDRPESWNAADSPLNRGGHKGRIQGRQGSDQ